MHFLPVGRLHGSKARRTVRWTPTCLQLRPWAAAVAPPCFMPTPECFQDQRVQNWRLIPKGLEAPWPGCTRPLSRGQWDSFSLLLGPGLA